MSTKRLLKGLVGVVAAAAAWLAAPGAWANPTIDLLTDAAYTSSSDLSLAALEFPPILITSDSTTIITTASCIRLVIPTTYSMAWDTSDTSVEVLLSGGGTVSTTVSTFPAGLSDRVCVLGVTANLDTTSRLILSGLGVRNWGADQAPATLGLAWDGTNTANVSSTQTFSSWRGSFASANNFSFSVGDTATLPSITIVEAGGAPLSITNTNGIRINIPNTGAYGTAPTWSTTITSATISGSGAGNLGSGGTVTGITYANGNRTCIIPVSTNFSAGESVTIAGLRFTTPTAAYTCDSLELSLDAGVTTISLDKRCFAIGPPTLQATTVPTIAASAPSTTQVGTTLTVTDTNGVITAASDLRFVIMGIANAGGTSNGRDNLTWTSNIAPTFTISGTGGVTAALLGVTEAGNGAGSGSSGRGRVVTVDVTTSFAAGSILTVSSTAGFQVSNSTTAATKLYIGLVIAGYTTNNATKAFGYIVSIATESNTTGSSGGGTSGSFGTGGGGVCFLRAAQRPSSQ